MRKARRLTLSVLLLLVVAASASASDERLRIVVLTPTTEGNTYWPQVHEILEAAAEDLNVELLMYDFDVRDRFAKQDEGVRILRQVEDVDGAIISVAFGQTVPLLQIAEQRGIPVMIQGPLFATELELLGSRPRDVFDSWIGLFSEDEFAKGEQLARVLIQRAEQLGLGAADGTISIGGLGGDSSWYGSWERAEGLRSAVDANANARLLQVVPTYWTEEEGYAISSGLMRRYPEVRIIWAASDQLAIEAARAIEDTGFTPGDELLTGGLDLSERGLESVRSGRLTATTASTLFGYAQILIYLTDYVRGFDFAPDLGTEITFPVYTATEENAQGFLDLYREHARIDFGEFSRALTPHPSAYQFDPEALHAAIRE
ncbi:MAG: ABC transporter substrate-binding protein [Spirochaetales bacterium]